MKINSFISSYINTKQYTLRKYQMYHQKATICTSPYKLYTFLELFEILKKKYRKKLFVVFKTIEWLNSSKSEIGSQTER